jgi:hypothetical protein
MVLVPPLHRRQCRPLALLVALRAEQAVQRVPLAQVVVHEQVLEPALAVEDAEEFAVGGGSVARDGEGAEGFEPGFEFGEEAAELVVLDAELGARAVARVAAAGDIEGEDLGLLVAGVVQERVAEDGEGQKGARGIAVEEGLLMREEERVESRVDRHHRGFERTFAWHRSGC